jgi:hypothetical protein
MKRMEVTCININWFTVRRQIGDPCGLDSGMRREKKEGIDFETGIGIGDSGFRVYTLHLHVLRWRHAAIKSMSMQATISIANQFSVASSYFI